MDSQIKGQIDGQIEGDIDRYTYIQIINRQIERYLSSCVMSAWAQDLHNKNR